MKKYRQLLLESSKHPKVKIILVAIFSVFVSYLYFGGNLKAQMGIIDDHTYISRGVLQNPSFIWSNFINAPEIKSFGDSTRFRIIYSLINNVETWMFGTNASYWYLTNILVFAFFIFCVFYITYENLGIKWAFPFVLFVIGQTYFGHIFSRLGTAEVWTILGLSIYALGFNSLYQKSKSPKISASWKECLAMISGTILTVGSKENFAVMGVLIIALLVVLKFRNKVTKAVVLSSVLMLLLNAYQILHIVLTQSKNGVDFYQNDSGVLFRLMKIFSGAFSGYGLVLSLSFLLFFAVLGVFVFFESKKRKLRVNDPILSKLFFQPMLVAIILFVFYLFNLYVYNGILYTLNRYAFPTIFAGQLLLLAFIKWAYDYRQYNLSQHEFKFLKVTYFLMLAILMFFMVKGVVYSREMSALNVEATVSFNKKLKKMIKAIKEHPDYPIVFSTYEPVDYEPLISVSYYLKYNGIENKMMVKNYNNTTADGGSPIAKWVSEENIKFEKKGGQNFIPYDISSSAKCFNIDFSDKTVGQKCENLGKIWRLGNYPY